jgi:hypothetical protein
MWEEAAPDYCDVLQARISVSEGTVWMQRLVGLEGAEDVVRGGSLG